MARPRVSSLDDPLVDLWISIPASMKRQLEDKKVNISALARGYFAEYLNSGSCEEEKVGKQFEEIEPKYLVLKSRMEEFDKRKQAAKSQDLEKQAKRDRWFQEVADMIKLYGHEAYKIAEIVEQRAGYCEMSVDAFKEEFERRYPGLIAKVYNRPMRKRPKR